MYFYVFCDAQNKQQIIAYTGLSKLKVKMEVLVFIMKQCFLWAENSLSFKWLKLAFQYVENVSSWNQACENMSIPSEIMVLETAIHQHQNLYESMCQAYTEVSIVGFMNVCTSKWCLNFCFLCTSCSKYSIAIVIVFVELYRDMIYWFSNT